MKKRLAFIGLLLIGLAGIANAQQKKVEYIYSPFRIDAGLFAFMPLSGMGYGGGLGVEPKFNLNKSISLGARFEIFAAQQEIKDVKADMQGKNLLLTFDWHITSEFYRPFVGFGIGYATNIAKPDFDSDNSHFTSDDNAVVAPTSSSYRSLPVGFLRTGFDIPHLRVGIQATVTGNTKVGGQVMNLSTIGIVVAVGIGGGRNARIENGTVVEED